MFRAISTAAVATILTLLLGCVQSGPRPFVLGSAGSIERSGGGEHVREAWTDTGYSHETVKGETRYKMVQSPGPGKEHALEAVEFKKELGRLADELGASLAAAGHTERQMVLLPATFVNLDDLYKTSTFGRLCSEQLAEELKNRDFQVIELRRTKDLLFQPSAGELALSREIQEIAAAYPANGLVLGTYVITAQQVMLTARLVQAKTNHILAVGTAIFDRHNNLFVNSLILREAASVRKDEGQRARVSVPVATQFVRADGRIMEEDLGSRPAPPPPKPPAQVKKAAPQAKGQPAAKAKPAPSAGQAKPQVQAKKTTPALPARPAAPPLAAAEPPAPKRGQP
jgi:TolB-like protein